MGYNDEKFYYLYYRSSMKILWFMKNQYLRGNCLKRGPAQFGDLRGGGGGWQKRGGGVF